MHFSLNDRNIFINKLKTIKRYRLLLLSVISSIILTEIIDALSSVFFHGKITYDYIITGALIALIVSLIIAYLLIRTQKELKKAHNELERRVEERTIALLNLNDQLTIEIELRKKAEIVLLREVSARKQSQEHLRLFIEHAPASLAMFDCEMRYLSVSHRWLNDYNLGERDLRGLSHYEVFPEMPERWKAIHCRALDGEVMRNDNDRFDRADGSVQWLWWEVRPWYDAAGDVAGIVVFTEDITDRKQAEEVLQRAHDELELQVIQRTSELSVINEELLVQLEERKRAEDRISRLNRLYSVLSKVNETIVRIHDSKELFDQVCRIAVEDGLFKMAWIGLIDPDSRIVKPTAGYGDTDGYLNSMKVYAADVPEGKGPTGTACFEGKYSISSDIENDPRMLLWREKALRHGLRSSSAFPIHAGSSVIGALTVYSGKSYFFTDEEIQLLTSLAADISFAIDFIATEKKRLAAEESLRIINEELEQRIAIRTADLEAANRELESFIYSVSHDLRAPLRHISGFADLVMKNIADMLDERGKRYLSIIHNGTEKMSRLIDDLLHLSRLSRQEIQKREVNMSTIAASIVNALREAHPGRSVEVDIKEDLTVFADPGLIEIVLSNLLGNAWKFTGNTELPRIEFGTIEQDGKITYYFRDNGAGFNQEYAGKMFWPFRRLHSETEFEGTGIGLAIVDRIISRHGGKAWAEGIEGKGATIYFSLT